MASLASYQTNKLQLLQIDADQACKRIFRIRETERGIQADMPISISLYVVVSCLHCSLVRLWIW